ncbi:MAG: cation-transporting P-type ATPase, partial [Christensenellales bacterium]
MSYFNKSVEQTLKELETTENGLKKAEADLRVSKYGLNKLPETKKQNLFVRFLLQFSDIMVIILLIAAIT